MSVPDETQILGHEDQPGGNWLTNSAGYQTLLVLLLALTAAVLLTALVRVVGHGLAPSARGECRSRARRPRSFRLRRRQRKHEGHAAPRRMLGPEAAPVRFCDPAADR